MFAKKGADVKIETRMKGKGIGIWWAKKVPIMSDKNEFLKWKIFTLFP